MSEHEAQGSKGDPINAFLIIAAIVGGAWWYFSADEKPADYSILKQGKEAIELHLINHANWRAVWCEEKSLETGYFVRCYPTGSKSKAGPLFKVVSEGEKPIVYAVNGKAMPISEYSQIFASNGSGVPVKRWSQPPIDIPATLAAFD